MPNFFVITNAAKTDIPDGLINRLQQAMVQATGKPEKNVVVCIKPDQMMIFAGTTEPCAVCEFGCLGRIGEQENLASTELLMGVLNKELGINKERMYINFIDRQMEDVG